jgi:hypothetical protein
LYNFENSILFLKIGRKNEKSKKQKIEEKKVEKVVKKL